MSQAWPELPRDAWTETRDTLHLWTQVVGKVRLALAPAEPEWAQVPLYVSARGLTTSPMPYENGTCQIDFDFIAHVLRIDTSDGRRSTIALEPRTVASFYAEVLSALRRLGIGVQIDPRPQEIDGAIPFDRDDVHASYDARWAQRFFEVLSRVDAVLKEHRARFFGRTTPVQFFWGTFDLTLARYSGRALRPPADAGLIERVGGDAEEIAAGFWPGDERFPEAACYAYHYPALTGLERAQIDPPTAFWSQEMGEFLLRYDDVRVSASPREALLAFFESTYRAAATLANWDIDALAYPRASLKASAGAK